MAHILAQPHQNYKQTIEQSLFRTVRYRAELQSYTDGVKEEITFDFLRLLAGTETQNRLVPHHVWLIKTGRAISGTRESQPHTRVPVP